MAAGLPEGITHYSWRHTTGLVLRAAGVPTEQIDWMLGHVKANTTTIYAPYDPDFCREAIVAIDTISMRSGGPGCASADSPAKPIRS